MAYTGELTPDDLETITEVRDEWMRVALSTDRCDREKAEAAVVEVYASINLPAPEIIWVDSPIGGLRALGNITGDKNFALNLRAQSQLDSQLRSQLSSQLRWKIGPHLRSQLDSQLSSQLWLQLRSHLRSQLDSQLRSQLGSHLNAQLWSHLNAQLWALSAWYDAYWLAYYRTASLIAPMPDSDELRRLGILTRAVKELGWWWPMQNVVILTDRPTAIRRDQQARLHHDTGPALTYADGFSLSSWHGTAVPDDFWTWDLDRALQENDAEIRRCAIDRLGWDSIIDRLTLVDSRPDPGNLPHEIRLYDLPANLVDSVTDSNGERGRLLIAVNGSDDASGERRVYGIPVSRQHTHAGEAVAETYGLSWDEYSRLQIRT